MPTLREIMLLQELQHENVIELIDVFPHKRNLYLVYEYMTSDLEAVIKDKANLRLREADVKAYMRAILQGLAACHGHWIMHRDVKPNNILLGPSGQVKLADFGAGRVFGSPNDKKFTTQVFARWYRAPEVLLRATNYSSPIDVFAMGCIMAELMTLRPLFPGSSEADQIYKICSVLGSPTMRTWPEGIKLAAAMNFRFPQFVPTPLSQLIPNASPEAIQVRGLAFYLGI